MGWNDIGLNVGLNQSKLKMYQRCPKQFEFVHIKGMRMPVNIKMTVGTAVHAGIELNYKQKLRTKRDIKASDMMDMTRDTFKRAVKSDGIKESKVEIAKSQDEAIIMVGKYREDSAPQFQPVVEPEYYFEVPIQGAKRMLYGTIDLLAHYLRKAKALVVSDSKTTRRSYDPKRADVDIQLTSYDYAATKLLKQKPRFVLFDTVVINQSKTARIEHVISNRTTADHRRFEDTFKSIEKGIDAGVFPPTDNEQTCSWCGFKSICHKGKSFI